MQKITDFKPFDEIKLPGAARIEPSGLLLVVGPNSAGKSQFLRDLHRRLIGSSDPPVVAAELRLNKPDLREFLAALDAEGVLKPAPGTSGRLRPGTTYSGTNVGAQDIELTDIVLSHNEFEPEIPRANGHPFLQYFGGFLVTSLFLENRLVALNATGSYDFESSPPQHDLQALYVEMDARRDLERELCASFGKTVFVDGSNPARLCLRVGDAADAPSEMARLSPRGVTAYRQIETEGDGLRSYAAICVAMLLGRRPVCLIDEPEMCLHPPQARNLGRFIGRFGTSDDRLTVVATHSSHVTRGILECAPNVQIIRLTRIDQRFESLGLAKAEVSRVLGRPSSRAESILDGVFAEAVVIVEGAGDRAVYQAAHDQPSGQTTLDVHFTAVGGIGGIVDALRVYRVLGVPVAVIADIDLVFEAAALRNVIGELTGENSSALADRAIAVSEELRRLQPAITPEAVRAGLQDLLASPMDWAAGDDAKVYRRLSDLRLAVDRVRRIKSSGVDGLPAALVASVNALFDDLASIGLFIVPVGELEQWLAGTPVNASTRDKAAWATAAEAYLRGTEERGAGDIWAFLDSVDDYLKSAKRPSAVHD